jgi:hypothetical protein
MTFAELRKAGFSFNIGPDGYTVWYQQPQDASVPNQHLSLLREPVRIVAQVREGCINPGNEAVEKAKIHHFMLQLER